MPSHRQSAPCLSSLVPGRSAMCNPTIKVKRSDNNGERRESSESPQGQALPRPPLMAVALVSATALAYEILLMRLFSITQWHHFAYMIISLALLGYGVSGTFVTLFHQKLLANFQRNYLCCLLLFAVSTAICYLLAQEIQFNALEILWDIRQLGRLLLIYPLLVLPFFLAASSMAMALFRFRGQSAGIYAADLIGAGCGSLGVIALLYLMFPLNVLLVIVGMGATAAVIALIELKKKSAVFPLLIVLILLVLILQANRPLMPNISPYKSLAQALRIQGTRIAEQKSSPLGLISVVESLVIPWRYAPGVSLNSTVEPPEQLALFTDADGMTAITRFDGDFSKVAYLDQQTSALAYHLRPVDKALIVGVGGGSGLLQAGLHQVRQIEGLEMNPQMVAIGKNLGEFSGTLFERTGTTMHTAEARGFLSQSKDRFDLIQIELLDSFNASSAGLYALHESYLYTIEALQEYLKHLSVGGFLSISRWVKVPPRDSLKLFATALDSLEKLGVESPEKRLLLIRGWQTSTMLIKNGIIAAGEIESLKNFCRQRFFDLAYYPGITSEEANRYNVLKEPYFYQGTQALISERADFVRRYKFNIAPATDDQPYFFHFLKPATIPEIIDLRDKGGLPFLEQSYLILVATLFQASFASVFLILLPLKFAKHIPGPQRAMSRQIFLYFFLIGLGFMLLEIALMQKYLLFLHHPLFATSLVLTAFLVFAGLGSACSRDLGRNRQPEKVLGWALCLLIAISAGSILLLDWFFALFLGQTIKVKMLLSIVMIAPLAFCMGMPFPLALDRLGKTAPELIPWAWGVNGCASVISAVLAILIAINFGFTIVILMAMIFYGVAFFSFPNRDNSGDLG